MKYQFRQKTNISVAGMATCYFCVIWHHIKTHGFTCTLRATKQILIWITGIRINCIYCETRLKSRMMQETSSLILVCEFY